MRIPILLIIVLTSALVNGCSPKPKNPINPEVYNAVVKSCPANTRKISLYYLNGDCSFCVGKALDLEQQNAGDTEMQTVLIAKTGNLEATKLLFADRIKSCILYDTSGHYDKLIGIGKIYTLSRSGDILSVRSDE